MIRVRITETIEDFQRFAEDIIDKDPRVIGLDTETSMDKQGKMGVDIIQLAIHERNILDHANTFQINIPGMECYTVYIFKLFNYYSGILPISLKKILESNKFIKVGCDITTDVVRLKNYYDFNDRGFVDTQYIAKSLGYTEISLDSLAKKFMNTNKMKVTKHNWDDNTVMKHYEYAAYDAYLSLCTYLHIINGFNFELNHSYEDKYEDANDIFNFLMMKTSVFSPSKPTTKRKIVNVLSNSYKNWFRDYDLNQINTKVDYLLKKWIDDKLIMVYDKDIYLISKESTLKKDSKFKEDDDFYDKIIIKGIKKIMPEKGMKRESLVNWIRNSYYQQYNMNERMRMAADFVTKMIEKGIFYKIGMKYLLHDE